jgi:acetyl esterase/lipase
MLIRHLIPLTAFCAVLATDMAQAGPLHDWLAGKGAESPLAEEDAAPAGKLKLPPGTRTFRDVAYGSDARQRFDVYAPANAKGAPIIVMVHGGGWAVGDKGGRGIVENKAKRWLPRGFVFASVNYRMLPEAPPAEQARDVARALAAIQTQASQWGGDPDRVVLMGHSAGAHLVALLSSNPALATAQGARRWLGTVVLDSAALDVSAVMSVRHVSLYDRAFGSDAAGWQAMSPIAQLTPQAVPMLAVCSSQRQLSCPDAARFVDKAKSLGVTVRQWPQNLSHMQINRELGQASAYTDAVETFMAGLDPALAAAFR